MSELHISKDTYKFLCLIYKEYLNKRKTLSKSESIYFSYVPESVYHKIRKNDCYSCLVELKNNNLVKTYIDGGFCLTDFGITTMENRFKNKVSEITDFISKFIP